MQMKVLLDKYFIINKVFSLINSYFSFLSFIQIVILVIIDMTNLNLNLQIKKQRQT